MLGPVAPVGLPMQQMGRLVDSRVSARLCPVAALAVMPHTHWEMAGWPEGLARGKHRPGRPEAAAGPVEAQ